VTRARTDPLVRSNQWKTDTRFGTWNSRSLCRSGSHTTVGRELARYKLDLVNVQEVRLGEGGNRRHRKSRGLLFFYEKRKENNRFGTGFFYTTE